MTRRKTEHSNSKCRHNESHCEQPES